MPQPSDDLFLELENVGFDPYEEKVLVESKILDDMLNAPELQAVSELALLEMDDKRRLALERMNAECPYIHTAVRVTGKLLQPYWDEMDQEYKYEEKIYKDEPLIASGYATLQMDMNDTKKWVTGHTFYITDTDSRFGAIDLVEDSSSLYGFAPVGQLEISYERNDSRTEEMLRQVFPGVLEKVEEIIATVGDDEAEGFRLLRQVTVPNSDGIPRDVYRALISFVWSKFTFDKEIPYITSVKGAFIDATNPSDPEKDNLVYDPEKLIVLLVKPQGLLLAPHYKKSYGTVAASNELHWYLDCKSAPVGYEEEMQTYQLPARNMLTFASVRKTVYQ